VAGYALSPLDLIRDFILVVRLARALHSLRHMWSTAMPRTPKDLADRMAARRRQAKADDGFARETFTQPREQARQTARAFLDRWPAAAYMSAVESWRELPGGEIEFTMKRLRSAD
jgi:hypothetical protein